MYYQECCQIICHLLGWDYLGNKPLGIGIFGKCIGIAFVRTDKEQGRGTLHGHWLVWIAGFNKLRKDLFSSDDEVRENAKSRVKEYIEKTFCSDYQYSYHLDITHTICNTTAKASDLACQCEDQVLRDSCFKEKCKETKGEIMTCSFCTHHNTTNNEEDTGKSPYNNRSSFRYGVVCNEKRV
jgi:hypothetical protein